ncbi:hypothetical protein AgCh_016816 [Apium graveolens]
MARLQQTQRKHVGSVPRLPVDVVAAIAAEVVKLLVYVSEKDLFAEFYRKKLSRHLLFDRSASDDHERLILTKLKQQCGGQFTSKMEGMVTDLVLARDNQNEYVQYRSSEGVGRPGIDLNVTVLTTGFWPTQKSSDLNLPSEMEGKHGKAWGIVQNEGAVRLLKYWVIGVEVVFFCWRVDEFCDAVKGILVDVRPYGPGLSLGSLFWRWGLVFVFRLVASGLFGQVF